jgi:hypothetical protein
MKNLDHDYEEIGGVWRLRHGAVLVEPGNRGLGDQRVSFNGCIYHQSELLLANYGFILADRAHHARWLKGDPKLPEPFEDYLHELSRWTPEVAMAYVRARDAEWDVYRAENRARHHA